MRSIVALLILVLSAIGCSSSEDKLSEPTPKPTMDMLLLDQAPVIPLAQAQTISALPLTMLDGHTAPIRDIDWSPDGQFIVSGSIDKSVKIWKISDASLLQTFTECTKEVDGVAWSSSGKLVAAACYDQVYLWKFPEGQLLRILKGPSTVFDNLRWSPDGQYLAAGALNNKAYIWEANTGDLVSVLSGHDSAVCSVAWSSDQQVLVTASGDATVGLWDVSKATSVDINERQEKSPVPAQIIEYLEHGKREIASVSWARTHSLFASADNDQAIRIWEVNNKKSKLVKSLFQTGFVVNWHPTEQILAIGTVGGGMSLWRIRDNKVFKLTPNYTFTFEPVLWSPNGRLLASASPYENAVRIWRIETR